jgi:hypothetical protein
MQYIPLLVTGKMKLIAVIVCVYFMLCSCASSRLVDSIELGNVRADFSNNDHRIEIDWQVGTLVIDDTSHEIINCSDESLWCLSSPSVGFEVAVPKKCVEWDSGEWAHRHIRSIVVGAVPHSRSVWIVSSGHPNFMFQVDREKGLTGIFYDGGRAAFDERRQWYSWPAERLFDAELVRAGMLEFGSCSMSAMPEGKMKGVS